MNRHLQNAGWLCLAVVTACSNPSPIDVDHLDLALDGEGEVIEVSGCSPGSLPLGEGSSMVCIPDPYSSNPESEPSPGHGDEMGGGPKLGKGRRKPPPEETTSERHCRTDEYATEGAEDCKRRSEDDKQHGRTWIHQLFCYTDDTTACCLVPRNRPQKDDDVIICEPIE